MFPLYDLNPHRRIPWFTAFIIVANVAVTIWMSTLTQQQTDLVAFERGFVPLRLTHVDSGKPVVCVIRDENMRGQVVRRDEAVQLSTRPKDVYSTFFTTMFLHGGWGHLLSNMWILWIFGNNVEDRLGHLLYLVYYLLGGVAATLCHWAINPNSDLPVVGASGAVAAVLGGYVLTYPWAKIRTLVIVIIVPFIFDIPALVWVGIWFVFQNVIPGVIALRGIVQDPVAYWAHIGGFLAGLVLMPVMTLGAPPPDADWRKEAEEQFQFGDPRLRGQQEPENRRG